MLIELVLSRSRLGQVQPGNTNRKESNRTEEKSREVKRNEQRTEQGYRFVAGYHRVASNGNCNGNGSAVRNFVM